MRQIFGPECFLLREGGAGDHNTGGDFHPEIIFAFSHEVKQHMGPSDYKGRHPGESAGSRYFSSRIIGASSVPGPSKSFPKHLLNNLINHTDFIPSPSIAYILLGTYTCTPHTHTCMHAHIHTHTHTRLIQLSVTSPRKEPRIRTKTAGGKYIHGRNSSIFLHGYEPPGLRVLPSPCSLLTQGHSLWTSVLMTLHGWPGSVPPLA